MRNFPPVSPDDLLTSADTARILNRPKKSISRWVKNGSLTPVTQLPGLRGAFLFRRSDVEALARKELAAAEAKASAIAEQLRETA